jgi:branched-chain amino acid transport system substrate-binding protein
MSKFKIPITTGATMKKFFTVTALTAALVGAAHADTIKIGVALGFTGPAESLAGPMAAGAERGQ